MSIRNDTPQRQGRSWRDHVKVHPAADLFPMMSPEELAGLIKDIKDKGGLIHPVVFYDGQLLDGRNRIEAGERCGLLDVALLQDEDSRLRVELGAGIDPYEYVLSANIHRRHLTAEQKRGLIAKLIKQTPDKSDRQIAKQTKSSPTTVGMIRQEAENAGDVSRLDTRTDTKGRKQPSTKPKKSVRAAEKREKPLERATGIAEYTEEQHRERMAALDEPADVNPIWSVWQAATEEQRREFVNKTWTWINQYYNAVDRAALGIGDNPAIPDDLSIPQCLRRVAEAAS